MSQPRGHVPDLMLGRYRTMTRARRALLREVIPLLPDGDRQVAREWADRLGREAHELRVALDDA